MTQTLDLLERLVRCKSITPHSAGALEIVTEQLEDAGFVCERLDKNGVSNLYASHGSGVPAVALCGHVDVVPPGDCDVWNSDPFEPTLRDGKLFGRGTTDMKGGVAALIVASTSFVRANPEHGGKVALLLTSDEEGEAVSGIRHVVDVLSERGQNFDHGLVGEPSSNEVFGDTLRVGRRGSLRATITVTGKQGHAAYPERAHNPIPSLINVLKEIQMREFSSSAAGAEPTIIQIVSINSDAGANNIIPGEAKAVLSIRYAKDEKTNLLRAWIDELCASCDLPTKCVWVEGATPYHTGSKSKIGNLLSAIISSNTGITPQPSVGGGTSDGRFLIEICAEVVEFGSVGRTMHQVNEYIEIAQLDSLVDVYSRMLEDLLGR